MKLQLIPLRVYSVEKLDINVSDSVALILMRDFGSS